MSLETHHFLRSVDKKVEPDSKNFGARLRGLIENKGLSLKQFARDYGIAESQVHNWLKRDHAPLAKHLPKLASFFGVSQTYILTGTPEKSEPNDSILLDRVAEEPAVYGDLSGIRRELRGDFEAAMRAAGKNRDRLGWLKIQLGAHISRAVAQWESDDAASDDPTKLSPLHSRIVREELARNKRLEKKRGATDQSSLPAKQGGAGA